ncbi:MAG TPA: PadR family transcriptional regulator [Candidatus Saccharimonas sp.]|nr:PadR family transcriptional regulator [Candidatus Saccharimonas sp.]
MHHPLSPATFHILLALATGERHGYDIMKQAAADSQNAVKLGPGTLYSTLKKMLELDLISETAERPDPQLDDSRRRYYRITSKGQAALGAELERLDHLVHLGHKLTHQTTTS